LLYAACRLTPTVLQHLRALEPLAVGVATELFDGGSWPERVERGTSWSNEALELSALAAADLDGAVAYLDGSLRAIRHLSLHAPLVLPEGGERQLAERTGAVASRLSAIVVHPHILEEPAELRPLGSLLALENMDVQKPGARDVAELEPYFEELSQARFCLDVAHVKTVDPTMQLGQALLDAFGDRLCELHISGIDAECTHVALEHADVERYEPVLRRCRHVPWILESLPADSASASAIQR
jgi:hypothetical protein